MGFNFSNFGNILDNVMYRDECSIFRSVTLTDKYGATRLERQQIYDKVSCKLSYSKFDTPHDIEGLTDLILNEVTIFMQLNYEVKAGDIIEIFRNGELVHKGIVNKPNRYDTHQEIKLEIKGRA